MITIDYRVIAIPDRGATSAGRGHCLALDARLLRRAIVTQNRRELLGLADQRIDQRRQRVAMGYDQSNGMRDDRVHDRDRPHFLGQAQDLRELGRQSAMDPFTGVFPLLALWSEPGAKTTVAA